MVPGGPVRDEWVSVTRAMPVDSVAADCQLDVDGAHEPDLRLLRGRVVGEKLADVEVVVLEDGHPVELKAGRVVVVGNEYVFGDGPAGEIVAGGAADSAGHVALVDGGAGEGDVLAVQVVPAEQSVRVA